MGHTYGAPHQSLVARIITDRLRFITIMIYRQLTETLLQRLAQVYCDISDKRHVRGN